MKLVLGSERRLRIVDLDEAADLPDKSQRIEDRIIVEEMNACVRGVIDSLPEDYRAGSSCTISKV
jgi:hypothetical protein